MWLLVAFDSTKTFCDALAEKGLFPVVRYEIRDNPSSLKPSCSILRCEKRYRVMDSKPVTIFLRDAQNQHSPQIKELLKAYLIIF